MQFENELTAFEQHQNLAQLYGAKGSIMWDLYFSDSKSNLQDKLKYFLPNKEEVDKEMENSREMIVESLWSQRKYCEGNLLTSITFVLHCPEIVHPKSSLKNTKNYSVHILFKIRKCFKEDTSSNCCMVFIDEIGRVYENWEDFINYNKFSEGVIIAPKFGVYRFDNFKNVILDYVLTPASGFTESSLKVGDYAATSLAIGSMITTTLTFVPPLAVVALPMTIASLVTGGISGIWTIGRSSAEIHDRITHNQSIGLNNRESRGAWLNIATGTIGIGAIGISQGVSAATSSIPKALQNAAIGVNGLSLTTAGLTITNNIWDLILKSYYNENITSSDMMQLSSSLFIFTHSIYNLHMANRIIKLNEENPTGIFCTTLKKEVNSNFRSYISHFDVQIPTESINDFIRPLNKIPNNKRTYNILEKMEKIINNENPISSDKNNKNEEYELNEFTVQQIDTASFILDVALYLTRNFFIFDKSSMIDALWNIYENIGKETLTQLIEVVKDFINEAITPIKDNYKILIPLENIVWEIFNASMLFSNGNVTIPFLIQNAYKIIEHCKNLYKIYQTPAGKQKCNKCGGFYSITSC